MNRSSLPTFTPCYNVWHINQQPTWPISFEQKNTNGWVIFPTSSKPLVPISWGFHAWKASGTNLRSTPLRGVILQHAIIMTNPHKGGPVLSRAPIISAKKGRNTCTSHTAIAFCCCLSPPCWVAACGDRRCNKKPAVVRMGRSKWATYKE